MNLRRSVLLSIVILQIVSFKRVFSIRRGALYNASDDAVTIYNATNFKAAMTDSTTAWLIEFYSSWCGHCIQFAPHFKQLARSVSDWKSAIRVGVIDCANDFNIGLCRDYEIMGYPTLRFFPPRAPVNFVGQLRDSSENRDVGTIRHDMVTYVESLQDQSMNLNPLTESDLRLLPRIDGKKTIIIAERNKSSFLGREAILAGPGYLKSNDIILHRLTFPSDKDFERFASKYEAKSVGGLATVIVSFNSKLVGTLIPFNGTSARLIKKAIADYLPIHVDVSMPDVLPVHSKSVAETKAATSEEINKRRYSVFISDLEEAVFYSLRHEIGMHSVIENDYMSAFKQYLEALVKYFPGREGFSEFLALLRVWVIPKDRVYGQDLVKFIDKIYVDDFKDWVGCKGSTEKYGGYTCGLWSAFHALTVNYFMSPHDSGYKMDVLAAIAGYINRFFGCRVCSHHFMKMYENDNPPKHGASSDEAVLWLWRAHNKANWRLSGESSDDPKFPKEVFPSRDKCPHCYVSSGSASKPNLWDEFERSHVLEFLKDMYGKPFRKNAMFRTADSGHHRSWSFFPDTDVILWLVVYTFSIFMLFLAYFKFRRSFSRFPFYGRLRLKRMLPI